MGDSGIRSRRAVLAAAASGAAALAANAALTQSVVRAQGEPFLLSTSNVGSDTTSLSATMAGDAVFAVSNQDISGPNEAIHAYSDVGTAVAGYSASGSGVHGDAMGAGRGVSGTAGGTGTGIHGVAGSDSGAPTDTSRTGVFGYAPASDTDVFGSGVWGVSGDVGVAGSGDWIGLYGESAAGYGLYVSGKIRLATRSGRSSVSAGKTSWYKTITGVTSSCLVIAVLQTVESGTWVRAAVASTNKITVYFNRALPSSSVVGWLVLDTR